VLNKVHKIFEKTPILEVDMEKEKQKESNDLVQHCVHGGRTDWWNVAARNISGVVWPVCISLTYPAGVGTG
jgi:hypothetical protein